MTTDIKLKTWEEFKTAYLATADAVDAANDNPTEMEMIGRAYRVWKEYRGDMDEAIRKADEKEAEDDDEEEEEEEDNTDEALDRLIDEVFAVWEAKGIRCERNWECCMTCGHSAMGERENYVFYHDQDGDRIRSGDKEVHLCFDLTEEGKRVVLETVAERPNEVHWAGADHTRILLCSDPKEMETAKKDDEERQRYMAERLRKKREEADAILSAVEKGEMTKEEATEAYRKAFPGAR